MDLEMTIEAPVQLGQAEFDRREGTWYCRVRTELTNMDTMPLKQLPISTVGKSKGPTAQSAGGDPYNRATSVKAPEKPQSGPQKPQSGRRTLDDMRKLSEEIKRIRGDALAHS